MQKTCKKCKKLKDLSEFVTRRQNLKTGLKTYIGSACKKCHRRRDRERKTARRADPEWRKKRNAQKRASRLRKKMGIKLSLQTYHEIKTNRRNYKYKRYHTDPNFRLLRILGARVLAALKGKNKSARTVKLIGISVDGCRQHIEAQFVEGMSWENYAEWHVDHIVPCASFDLSDDQEQRLCFHYTNLEPLWGPDNMGKGATITPYVAQRKWTGQKWVNTVAPWLLN